MQTQAANMQTNNAQAPVVMASIPVALMPADCPRDAIGIASALKYLHGRDCRPEVLGEWVRELMFRPAGLGDGMYFIRTRGDWVLTDVCAGIYLDACDSWIYYAGRWVATHDALREHRDALPPREWMIRADNRKAARRHPHKGAGPFNVFNGYSAFTYPAGSDAWDLVAAQEYILNCWCGGDETKYKWLVEWFADAMYAVRPRKEVFVLHDPASEYTNHSLLQIICSLTELFTYPINQMRCEVEHTRRMKWHNWESNYVPRKLYYVGAKRPELRDRLNPSGSPWLDAVHGPTVQLTHKSGSISMDNYTNVAIYVDGKTALPKLHECAVIYECVPCYAEDPVTVMRTRIHEKAHAFSRYLYEIYERKTMPLAVLTGK